MSYNTASAIFQGKLLIQPEYANAQLPLILQQMKDQVADKGALHSIRQQKSAELTLNIPSRKPIISFKDDCSFTKVYGVTPYTSTDRLDFESIVVIDVVGPIYKYGSWYSWGSVELMDLIVRMANSERVKGIILNVDSPGGQAAGTADLAKTIRAVTAVKPVIAIIADGMAASAGYWIASAAQEIYVTQPTDQVGSIGAYQTVVDLTDYYAKAGILVKDVYAPQSDDKNGTFREAVAGDESSMKEDLRFLVEHFISNVKANRGGRLRMEEKEPFTGKMYYAAQAQKIGLIDGVKPFPAVVKRIEQLISVRS
jgi:protease-4